MPFHFYIMPLYDFEDTKTGKQFELQIKIAEKEKYLKDNPHIQQIIGGYSARIGDSIRLGITKPDKGFREVLQRIQAANPRARGINIR